MIQCYAVLSERNTIFEKDTELALIAMEFQLFYDFCFMTCKQNFQDSLRTVWYFWTGFFANCQKHPWAYLTWPGSCDPDPGGAGELEKIILHFFWFWVYLIHDSSWYKSDCKGDNSMQAHYGSDRIFIVSQTSVIFSGLIINGNKAVSF